MQTNNEWRDAYNYLLARLRQIDSDSSLILEIQQAAATRVEADLEEGELMQSQGNRTNSNIRRVVREELDLSRYRAPTPREAFFAAISVLVTRLREVPAVAERLQVLFEREPQNLQWLADAAENEFSPAQESFDVRTFSLTDNEKTEIEASLESLENLLDYREGRWLL